MRSVRTAAAAAMMSLLLAGCTGDPAPVTEESTVVESAAPSSPAAEPAAPPVLSGAAMATADLEVTACPPGSGSVTATGTVSNSADAVADYLVVVTWLGADGGVLASSWAEVPAVGAGTTAEWSATGELGGAQAAGCTTRLTRGTLAP